MPHTTVIVPTASLLAMRELTASPRDQRVQLQGVRVEPGRLIATSGHVAGVLLYDQQREDTLDFTPFTIPRDLLQEIKPRGDTNVQVLVYDQHVSLHQGLASTTAPLVDAEQNFPRWRAVYPPLDEEPGAVPQYDPYLLSLFGKVAERLGVAKRGCGGVEVTLHPQGPDAAAYVAVGRLDTFLGRIMPLQQGYSPRRRPQFGKLLETVL